MENIRSLNTYNTDTHSSWGIGQITKPSTWTFEDVLRYAIEIKANIIVKPSKGMWYIKGINSKKSYEDIKSHLKKNVNSKYKKNSITWLLSYF